MQKNGFTLNPVGAGLLAKAIQASMHSSLTLRFASKLAPTQGLVDD